MTKPSVHPSLGNSGSAQRPCEVSQGNLCFLRRDGNHWIFCSGKKCLKRHRGRAQRRHLWNNSTRARATRRVLGPSETQSFPALLTYNGGGYGNGLEEQEPGRCLTGCKQWQKMRQPRVLCDDDSNSENEAGIMAGLVKMRKIFDK